MLDHTAYPSVVETIIRVAPYTSLLALRTASRDFRARADAHLAKHLVCDWYAVNTVLRGDVYRHPAFWALCTQPQVPRAGGYYALPSPLGDDGLLGDWVGERLPRSHPDFEKEHDSGARRDTVLDIAGPQSVYPLVLLTRRLRPATTRLWVCGTPTDVDAPLALDTHAVIVMGKPYGPPGPLSVHEEPALLLTSSIRRVVYHLTPKYAANAALFRQVESRAELLGRADPFELVVIVSGALNRRGGFLLWEIVHLGREYPHLHITVVNPPPTPMDSYYPGPVSSQQLARECATFREWAKAVIMRDRGPEAEWARAVVVRDRELGAFEDQWSFYSLEEYAHVVEPRRYALEMGEMA